MPTWSTARTPRERLLGLTLRKRPPDGAGLLIERCRSVHTFGMRYALDLLWVDSAGTIVRVDRDIPPNRIRSCRAARAVLELPAGSTARHGLAPGAPVPRWVVPRSRVRGGGEDQAGRGKQDAANTRRYRQVR